MPKNKAEFNVAMQIFLFYEAKDIIGSSTTDYVFLGFNDFFIEQVYLAESGKLYVFFKYFNGRRYLSVFEQV